MTFSYCDEGFIRLHVLVWAKEYCRERIRRCGKIYNTVSSQREKEDFLMIITTWAKQYKTICDIEDD